MQGGALAACGGVHNNPYMTVHLLSNVMATGQPCSSNTGILYHRIWPRVPLSTSIKPQLLFNPQCVMQAWRTAIRRFDVSRRICSSSKDKQKSMQDRRIIGARALL
jgi:hypothetical protein